ncbi:unnamed protein product [Mytilus coruscus]|uniref:Uncharacterized protein n=1 Tax=Mytilus coruscus TaxID=42192 RepID=A0A6J8B602_MYTCO|nr:unnamed protein product [Mytilus coruscus]
MALTTQSILAYCASITAFSLISGAFSFYYVKVFMNFYHIDEKWFQMSQVLFMIWNAINDPLFAYVQDSTNLSFTKTRRESIMYSGPLFALSFIIPWIPWGHGTWIVGLHLIVALFIWDTMFTFVGLAVCSLFSELSKETNDRITLTRFAEVARLFGGTSVLFLEFTSDSLHNFRAFQITTAFLALVSWTLFRYTGKNAHTEYDLKEMNLTEKKDGDVDISHAKTMDESYCKQTCQILSDRNFISFVITNFFHQFHNTFLSNFTAIICDQLITENDIPLSVRKTFYGATTISASVLVIFGAPLIRRYSYFSVIRCSYMYTVVAGIVMYVWGWNKPWLLMLFVLLDSCVTFASFSLFNMPLSDIADDNMTKYKRKHPISSMVFGTNALITKPAISLAPMFVVAILNLYGYSELKDQKREGSEELRTAMFTLVCFYSVIIGAIQFISWSFFSIRGKTNAICTDF